MKRTNQISIKNLQFQPVVGVYSHERVGGQVIEIDVTLEYTRPGLEDDVATTIDYDEIVSGIEKYLAEHKPYLIETIGEAVLDVCFSFSSVHAASAVIRKPKALRNGLASITVSRNR